MLEDRLHLDSELIQNASLALLAESALVSFIVSPFIHHHADRFRNDNWLLAGLVGELLGSMMIASADSCMTEPLTRVTWLTGRQYCYFSPAALCRQSPMQV